MRNIFYLYVICTNSLRIKYNIEQRTDVREFMNETNHNTLGNYLIEAFATRSENIRAGGEVV